MFGSRNLLRRKTFLAPLILKEICLHPDGSREGNQTPTPLIYKHIYKINCQDLGPVGQIQNFLYVVNY